MNLFNNRNLLIATKHGKESVIAELLEKNLGVKCSIATNFDTDQFGTFSGELERKGSALENAEKKCDMAKNTHSCDLILSSEGSFGSHPYLFYLPADEEILFLKDYKYNLKHFVKHISTKTNYSTQEVETWDQVELFYTKAKFPSHGLILKNNNPTKPFIFKEIKNIKTLKEKFFQIVETGGKATIETDMRANQNPTRMKVIKETTRLLLKVLQTKCPNCLFPGFKVTDVFCGLPCKLCGLPTNSTNAHLYSCQNCNYQMEKKYPFGKKVEDPLYCNFCNP